MTELHDRRREAALDADLNVSRIADALERLGDLVALLLEPEPGEEREQDPSPDDAPASPEDAEAWRPEVGKPARLYGFGDPREVMVDRLYTSEGVALALILEDEKTYRVAASTLRAPWVKP
jgi:hypothetical protein